MDWQVISVLFISFFLLLGIGTPISFAIALSSLFAITLLIPFDVAALVVAQKLATGIDSFSLLAIPFFILAGAFMNQGGIAHRLIAFAKLFGGLLPGALAHVNILSNLLFGAISGSAVASAAAVGSTMTPVQKAQGYAPTYSAAVNISSCSSGLIIPPSNALIIYALISGGTSISALFLAGYIPGLLMGLGLMLCAGVIAKKHGYPVIAWPGMKSAVQIPLEALPSLGLIVLVMGGIIYGVFTATEASAVAVAYAAFLAVICYRNVKLVDIGTILQGATITSAMVLLLIGASMAMSWAMAISEVPLLISNTLLSLTENPLLILLIINIILLAVGIFMDLTPALLIFTPIFLPVATALGIHPVHFGIVMTFNLCIGICTPPVGSALFVGCSVAQVKIQSVIKPLLPFYFVLLTLLMIVTFVPELSLALPRAAGLIE